VVALAIGSEVRVKMRKGGTVRHRVTELEPGRLLATEAPLPSARLGYRHVVDADGDGSRIEHAITVSGPLWPFWALMLGRGRLRKAAATFVERERELVEPRPVPSSRRRKRRGRGR
jgi:hypothetical protein